MRCVYCGKAKEKNKEISFHRFPKDEKLVKTWVMNMGRLDLVPKQWHMLCAEHFSKTCIDFRDLRARLRKGSVPTIFKHNKENFSLPSATELIVHVSKQQKLDGSSGGQEIPEKDLHITSPMKIQGQRQEICVIQTEVISHDHTYVESGEVTQRKLEITRARVKKLMNEKKDASTKDIPISEEN
uniref:Thap3 protein n=1 Tax=Fopius arisanus TaxID=64838 RepID=A0A0C9PT35_9HYME